MYDAVLEVQESAIVFAAPGKKLFDAYDLSVKSFTDKGWHAGDKGFVHGLGHGLGLDIHESPRANPVSTGFFEVGNVITIEPGLYYPELGGVRIEDVIVITEQGCENLTNYPKNFTIS
jgi:Xaa-Pro aminopeptidase